MEDAVYVVEFRSISYGIGALDRMVKNARVSVLYAGPICIGKYLVALGGDVADVLEAKEIGEAAGSPCVISAYLLTGAHPTILGYFSKKQRIASLTPESVGIFETKNAASGFMSLDAALKSGHVELLRLWLGQYLGGKFCYVVHGTLSDVQEAVKAARSAVAMLELVGDEVIASPDKATLSLLTR